MALNTSTNLNLAGNTEINDGIKLAFDTMTNVATPSASQASISAGTGAPTFAAAQGSLYLRLDGSSTSTRAYINTTGSTTWTNITTAA